MICISPLCLSSPINKNLRGCDYLCMLLNITSFKLLCIGKYLMNLGEVFFAKMYTNYTIPSFSFIHKQDTKLDNIMSYISLFDSNSNSIFIVPNLYPKTDSGRTKQNYKDRKCADYRKQCSAHIFAYNYLRQ